MGLGLIVAWIGDVLTATGFGFSNTIQRLVTRFTVAIKR
jgi:hypothetical protein